MFMWGVGVKATFFRADNGLYVGGGALFTHSFSNDYEVDVYNGGVLTATWDVTTDIYRLTPELHAGWHIGDTGLTPYIGVDYVWSKAMSEYRVPASTRSSTTWTIRSTCSSASTTTSTTGST